MVKPIQTQENSEPYLFYIETIKSTEFLLNLGIKVQIRIFCHPKMTFYVLGSSNSFLMIQKNLSDEYGWVKQKGIHTW